MKINPKGSLHFTYVKAYKVDWNDHDALGKTLLKAREDAQRHYEEMFTDDMCCVVAEWPERVSSAFPKNNGLIVFTVDIGVFFDFPWGKNNEFKQD